MGNQTLQRNRHRPKAANWSVFWYAFWYAFWSVFGPAVSRISRRESNVFRAVSLGITVRPAYAWRLSRRHLERLARGRTPSLCRRLRDVPSNNVARPTLADESHTAPDNSRTS
jgi:hypothetical protein